MTVDLFAAAFRFQFRIWQFYLDDDDDTIS